MSKEQINIFLIGNPDHNLITTSLLNSIGIATVLTVFKHAEDIPPVESPVKADVIFIDLSVTQKNDFKDLNQFQKLRRLREVPIIVFSDSTYLEDITAAFELGANMYVPKSIFNKNKTNALKTIFKLNWKTDLLVKDKKLFVLAEVNKLMQLNSY